MIRVVAIAALFAVGTAYGVSLGMGGFYALSIPVGGERFDPKGDDFDAETSLYGFGGKFYVGVTPAVFFDYSFGYHVKYNIPVPGSPFFDVEFYWSAIPITSGVSYKFDLGAVKPYFGLGGAYIIMGFHAKDENESVKDRFCYPGAYVGGGVTYEFTDTIALDVNPRYMTAIDPDDGGMDFQFFDFLIGVNFNFI